MFFVSNIFLFTIPQSIYVAIHCEKIVKQIIRVYICLLSSIYYMSFKFFRNDKYIVPILCKILFYFQFELKFIWRLYIPFKTFLASFSNKTSPFSLVYSTFVYELSNIYSDTGRFPITLNFIRYYCLAN